MHKRICTVVLLAAAHIPAQAVEEDIVEIFGDEELLAIATGTKQPLRLAPSVASVVTAEDIAKAGATDINQALELVPGLHVYPSNLNRMQLDYSIRGIHTGQNAEVLVLMNGTPIQNVYDGGRPSLLRIPVSHIERIEIMRGPGSAVYGADAYAGVINIITKTGKDIAGTKFQLLNGSFKTRGVAGAYGGEWQDWNIALSAEMQKSEGDRNRTVDSDLQTLLDGAGTNASHAPGAVDTRYNTLDVHFSAQNNHWALAFWRTDLEDAGVGAGAAQALDPEGSQDNTDTLATLAYNLPTQWGNWNTKYSYWKIDYKVRFTLLPPGTTVPIGADGNVDFAAPVGIVNFPDGLFGNPGAEEDMHHLETVGTGKVGSHNWRAAIGGKHQKSNPNEQKNFGPGVIDGTDPVIDGDLTDVTGTDNIYIQEHSRSLHYLSLQDEWGFMPDWRLTAGARYDDYSDFGHTFNPRLALVWETLQNLTTKLLFGRAYRAPAFGELYAMNNPVALGNKELDPERIRTFELAFDYRPIFDMRLGLNIFTYRAKDLIDAKLDDGQTTSTYQNKRDQEGRGAEFEFNWKTTDTLKLWGNTSFQNATDADTGDRIADAPRWAHTLGFDWTFLPQWRLTPRVNMIADRARVAADPEKAILADTRDEIDDYTVTDISIRRAGINKAFDVSLIVRNAFDTDAREPSNGIIPDDYPMEGRAIYAQINANFD